VPVYEYMCDSCGRQFEMGQSINDLPVEICAECSGKVRRIISGGSGFIMKGTGSVQTRCGKTRTCCGSKVPCETPSCGHGE
jgi:putative FmdB family regulatory protein